MNATMLNERKERHSEQRGNDNSYYMRYNNCNLLDRKGEIKNVEIER